MTVENEKIAQIIEQEQDCLKSIHEGIIEGVQEGIREGVASGLKRGARDGLKECLAESLSDVSTVDISDVLDSIGEAVVRAAISESTKNIFAMSAHRYIQSICERLVKEIQDSGIVLSEALIRNILDLVEKSEQEVAEWMVNNISGNPFVREFATGIQEALEESLQEEMESCADRLRHNAVGSS